MRGPKREFGSYKESMDGLSHLGYLMAHAKRLTAFSDKLKNSADELGKQLGSSPAKLQEFMPILNVVRRMVMLSTSQVFALSSWTQGIIKRDLEVESRLQDLDQRLAAVECSKVKLNKKL